MFLLEWLKDVRTYESLCKSSMLVVGGGGGVGGGVGRGIGVVVKTVVFGDMELSSQICDFHFLTYAQLSL
jgi:hypothetical protein